MARKNKRNRRRASFYGISKFDYEARERLAAGQLPPQKESEEKVVEESPGNEWTEAWTPKITIVQQRPRKA